MVSNEEIAMRLRNKREGKSLRYLVCDNCGGYYELQEDESWKDFDTECECGGQLVQSANDSLQTGKHLAEEEYEHRLYETEIIIAYVAFFFFFPLSVILAIYLLSRHNKRAKLHGKILLLISIIPFLIIGIISALLIYSTYFSGPGIDPATDISSVRSMRLIATCFFNL
jgi:ABC-type multidrug transport system permease subunit